MGTKKNDPSNGKINNFENRFVDKDKGPIKIRVRERANGNFVLYLDRYIGDGKHKCESLDLFLVPENGRNDSINKNRNNKTWEQAKAIKAERIIDKQNGDHGFSLSAERQNMDLLKYVERLTSRDDGTKDNRFIMLLGQLKVFTKGEKTTFADVDRDYLLRFIDYLKHEAKGTRVKSKTHKPLSHGSQRVMMTAFCTVFSRALKDNIIELNPFMRLTQDEKIKGSQSHINYLTVQEVQKLIDTPFRYDTLKRAFLFSCSTGLRFSDVSSLRWCDIRDDDFFGKVMDIQVKKTRRREIFPVPEPALHFLPDRDASPDDAVIFPLKYDASIGVWLQQWADAAGIKKKVRFHVSRHTAATMNLALGADIATVSKLLGHSSIKMTEIYAEVINESKKKAVALQNNVFKF